MDKKKAKQEIEMLTSQQGLLSDQKRTLERMTLWQSIAVALIGILLVGAMVSLAIQSERLADARGTINELNQRLAVSVDRPAVPRRCATPVRHPARGRLV